MENILEVSDLVKTYEDFRLEHVGFSLPQGKIMGMVGENGAGKTTIIKLILNSIIKESGTIKIFGKDNLKYEKENKLLIRSFKIALNKRIGNYSSGMKVKLTMASIFTTSPKLIILDEPTTGLDPVVRDYMLELYKNYAQTHNASILFSSHIISDVEKIADYITFVHEGKIIFSLEKDKLLEKYVIEDIMLLYAKGDVCDAGFEQCY